MRKTQNVNITMGSKDVIDVRVKYDIMVYVYCLVCLFLHVFYNIYDIISWSLAFILLYMLWHRYFGYRSFLFGFNDIKELYGENSGVKCHWAYYVEGVDIKKVYIKSDIDWYEIDKDLYFPKGLTYDKYKSFISSNDTFGKLYQTLRLNIVNMKTYKGYQSKVSDYEYLRWFIFVILTIGVLVYYYIRLCF